MMMLIINVGDDNNDNDNDETNWGCPGMWSLGIRANTSLIPHITSALHDDDDGDDDDEESDDDDVDVDDEDGDDDDDADLNSGDHDQRWSNSNISDCGFQRKDAGWQSVCVCTLFSWQSGDYWGPDLLHKLCAL